MATSLPTWTFGLGKINEERLTYSNFLNQVEQLLTEIRSEFKAGLQVQVLGEEDYVDFDSDSETLFSVVKRCRDTSFLGKELDESPLTPERNRFAIWLRLKFESSELDHTDSSEISFHLSSNMLRVGKNAGKIRTSLVCNFEKCNFSKDKLIAKNLLHSSITSWSFDFGSLTNDIFRDRYQQADWVERSTGGVEKIRAYEGLVSIGWLTYIRTIEPASNIKIPTSISKAKIDSFDRGLMIELCEVTTDSNDIETLELARKLHLQLNSIAKESEFSLF